MVPIDLSIYKTLVTKGGTTMNDDKIFDYNSIHEDTVTKMDKLNISDCEAKASQGSLLLSFSPLLL